MDDTVPRNVFDSLLDSLMAARKETEDLRKRLEESERRIAALEETVQPIRRIGARRTDGRIV